MVRVYDPCIEKDKGNDKCNAAEEEGHRRGTEESPSETHAIEMRGEQGFGFRGGCSLGHF